MVDVCHLPRAPITEALVDLRVAARADLDASEFRSLEGELSEAFPSIDERRQTMVSLHLDPTEERQQVTRKPLGISGLWFRTANRQKLAQFRVDGFTFNWMKPYDRWEALISGAMALWDKYKRIAQPNRVTRVALRYINDLEFPSEDLDRYLRAPRPIPDSLRDGDLVGCRSRITIRDGTTRNMVHVTQELRSAFSVLLDIDAYYEVAPEDDLDISAKFDELRDLKNRAFFGSITKEAVELYR